MLLDRYIIRQFLSTFFFTLLALSLLFVIIDLFDKLDVFLDKNASLRVAVLFYIGYLPEMLKLLIPVATLMACLFGVGRLTSTNELTAMRAAGKSFFRFMLPYVLLALVISVGQVYFNGWVVPEASELKYAIERDHLGSSAGGSLTNLSFRESPTRNVLIERYDDTKRTAYGVAIEEFGSTTNPRLQWRIDASSMVWDSTNNHWHCDAARKRTFSSSGVEYNEMRNAEMPFSISHEQMIRLQQLPEEMTLDDKREYIVTLRKGGKNTRDQEIAYYAEWAFPWSNVIVMLIAVPFASVRRRGGIAVNVAAAMLLAFGYIGFSTASQAIGSNLEYSAEVVGWSANGVFLLLAFVNVLVLRR